MNMDRKCGHHHWPQTHYYRCYLPINHRCHQTSHSYTACLRDHSNPESCCAGFISDFEPPDGEDESEFELQEHSSWPD